MTTPKNLNLFLSGIVVIIAGVVYGGHPTYIMPELLGFEVIDLELKNMLRAVMGIYIGVGLFWVLGSIKAELWYGATLCNVLFMGGISFGRIVSTLFDGISPLFTPALVLELLFFVWGWYNLKTFKEF
ncbi:DUF4345 domain-containing protein [Maribacter hydrothermalis]|uniref:DUF4345 domain-containing protein n=1 Tax=Maribacter hydrothermalis TaxID=1836467 RepID=A0A1B7Z200_9FLAO|nr:DUF4345 domain-containing protein [Maribacter hydrothermalis]APQ18330.1 hypothetical protein BTR34_13785 [Maribacter hydrothermalis]OBR36676.1 hypothetical protein A9200_09680 [Maribacter hydrothermalis]